MPSFNQPRRSTSGFSTETSCTEPLLSQNDKPSKTTSAAPSKVQQTSSLLNSLVVLALLVSVLVIAFIYLTLEFIKHNNNAHSEESHSEEEDEEPFFGERAAGVTTSVEPQLQGQQDMNCWAHSFATVAMARVPACVFEGSREAIMEAMMTEEVRQIGSRPYRQHFQAVEKTCGADAESQLCICLRSLDIQVVSSFQAVKEVLPTCSKLVTKDRSQTTFLAERANQRPLWIGVQEKSEKWRLSDSRTGRHAMVAECLEGDKIRVKNSWGSNRQADVRNFPTHDEFGRFFVDKDALTDGYTIVVDVTPRVELISLQPLKKSDFWGELLDHKVKEFKTLKDQYLRLVELCPQNAEGWFLLAQEMNGKSDSVVLNGVPYSQLEALEQATVLNPEHGKAWYAKYQVAQELEEVEDEGKAYLERALAITSVDSLKEADQKKAWKALEKLGGGVVAGKEMSKKMCRAKIAEIKAKEVKVE